MRCTRLMAGLALAAAMALSTAAGATVISDWPSGSGFDWENQPLAPYVSGSVVLDGTTLKMSGFTSVSKTSWLPYGGSYAEKFCIAQLVNAPARIVGVHAKAFDPGTTGKSGWSIILKDSGGKILDFGIRPFLSAYGPGKILSHEYDGAGTWSYGPPSGRNRTGNNYYTLDFTLNADGTIAYSFDAWENGTEWSYGNTTTVAYSDISEIYLAVATPDTTGAANYKWTEFDVTVVPEPGSLLALCTGITGLAGFAIRRRRA